MSKLEETPKKKLPKIIKSLPKLGLFARVVVEKLTQEEIDSWTRGEHKSESTNSETVQSESSSEEENSIVRKRRRVTYLDSSGSSSPDTSTSDTSDSSDGEGRGFSARNTRHFGRRRRKKEEKQDEIENHSGQRVQPVRSAKRNPVIIYSDDSEEDDSINLVPVNFKPKRQPSSKSVDTAFEFSESSVRRDDSLATVSAASSSNTISESEPSTSNAGSKSSVASTSKEIRNISADPKSSVASTSNEIRNREKLDNSAANTLNKIRNINAGAQSSTAKTSSEIRNKNVVSKKSVANTLNEIRSINRTLPLNNSLRSDIDLSNILCDRNATDKRVDSVILRPENPAVSHRHRYAHTLSESDHFREELVSGFVFPSSSGNAQDFPAAVNNNEAIKLVSADDNIDDLDKFTVVNNDQTNVGKIRLRSLQSLGASENFIKEANLKQGSRVEKMVQHLYSNHVSSTNNLLNEISENLKEKLSSTEDFNRILKEMQHQNKRRPEEIVNEQLENIVKKRQEYDANICKLFTEVVESFYKKLGQRQELENFPTLMYLGFLYILNFFIKITHNRYKKSSLFKNVVLVFTESLRNGNFKYDNIIHFFLSNNFHAHCFKLIEHIGSIQSQSNLSLLKINEEPSPDEKELRAVPVRKISYKMMDSRMVIEYSKTLEEVETEGAAGNDSSKKSYTNSSPSPKPLQSKSVAGNPSPSGVQSKSVIVSSRSNKPSISLNKNVTVINNKMQNALVTNAPTNTVKPNQSHEALHNSTSISGDTQNSSDGIILSDLLKSSKSSSNGSNVGPFSFQNKQTSVIHTPQQVSVSHLATPKAPSVRPSNIVSAPYSQTSVLNSVNAISSNPISINVSNSHFLSQMRSTLGNGKNSKVQIVRPILKAKQSPRPSPKPMNYLNSVPQSSPLRSTEISSPNENAIDRSKNHEILSRSVPPMTTPILAKRPIAPQVVENISVGNPPAYSQAVINRVENVYQTSAASSPLRQVLLSSAAKKNSNMSSDQQFSDQLKNNYNTSSNVIQGNSMVSSGCHPSNVYQPTLQSQGQYVTSNPNSVGNQVSNSDGFAFPVDNMVSSPINQEMQSLYQVQHNQNMVSSTSALYNDNSNPGLNTDLSSSSSVLYGNNQLNNQSLYYNNNIASNPMILCDMLPNAGNQDTSAMYYNYTQPVSTLNQVPRNPVHPQPLQLNQVQTQAKPLNAADTQSVNQFQPMSSDAGQYYSPPTTTIHWVSQPSSYTTPSMVQTFPNQMHYQNYQPSQENNL